MRRLSRAVALIAVALALAPGLYGCKKDEAKKTDAPAEPKPADPAAAGPTGAAQPAQPGAPGTSMDPAVPTPQAMAALEHGARPASITDEQVAVAQKVVDATTKFVNELDAVKDDCKKATAVLKGKTGKDLKAAVEEGSKLQAQIGNDPATMQWFHQTFGPKMMSTLGKLGGVFNKCRQDKNFEAAFRGLGLGGNRPPPAHGGKPPAAAPPSAAPPGAPSPPAAPATPDPKPNK
jgi:hypothetical protein